MQDLLCNHVCVGGDLHLENRTCEVLCRNMGIESKVEHLIVIMCDFGCMEWLCSRTRPGDFYVYVELSL